MPEGWRGTGVASQRIVPALSENKAGLHNTGNLIQDGRSKGRVPPSAKSRWMVLVMAILLLGLVLGLSIGLTLGNHHSPTVSSKHQSSTNSPPAPHSTPSDLPAPLGALVDLGYTKYRGETFPGPNGISQWLGVRYAQPPLGNLRFAAPQNVTVNSTLQMATQRGPYCLGTLNSLNQSTPIFTGAESEDCLNLDIYAPYNVTASSKLPVYFFIQGGGFNTAYPTQNGSSLVQASGGNIIVVSINYRVSAYGFLASAEVQSEGSLNNGLKDQRMALQWVQNHITAFGGDPGHVVMGGDSAGGGSVTMQLGAYSGRNDGLFHATAAESQSFGALRTVAESQYQYNSLVNRTGCTGHQDTLSCLRGLDITDLQTQNILTRFPNTTADPLFPYNPTLDHDFIADYPLNLFSSGRFVKLPAIYGDVSNEGTVFVPKDGSATIDQSNAFLQAQFPLLNATQLTAIQSLYPPETQVQPSNAGEYWRSTADAYGDLRYVCPGFFVSNATAQFASKAPDAGNWNYHYNVTDPGEAATGLGVPHVAEQSAIWAKTSPPSYTTSNKPIIPLMQGYWVSFVRTFDPNTFRAPGAPVWADWGKNDGTGGNRLLVQNPGPKGNISTTGMESVSAQQRILCQTLLGWGVDIKQ